MIWVVLPGPGSRIRIRSTAKETCPACIKALLLKKYILYFIEDYSKDVGTKTAWNLALNSVNFWPKSVFYISFFLNRIGWAKSRLKLLSLKQIHIVKLSSLTVAIYGLMIYIAPYVRNAFDEGKSITRASGRGLGPGNRDFFGAQIVTYIKERPGT
jgi:hypothetical protein